MWKETSAEVYAVIMAKHRKELVVHSSFSDPTGTGHHFSSGSPEMLTEWGFKDSEQPLLKIVQRKDREDDKEWDVQYCLYCA